MRAWSGAKWATLARRAAGARDGQTDQSELVHHSGILAALDEEAARRKLTRSAFVEMIARHMLSGVAYPAKIASRFDTDLARTMTKVLDQGLSVLPSRKPSV